MATKDRIYTFGEYRLDVRERRLWQNDVLLSLPPKTFDLLVIMLASAGRLLEKDYLIRSVWPDSYVQDANLSVHIANIRRTLGRTSEVERFIETVPKVGYRFVAPVFSLLDALPSPSVAEGQTLTANSPEGWSEGAGVVLTPEPSAASSPEASTKWRAASVGFRTAAVAAIACVLLLVAFRFMETRKEGTGENGTSTTPLASTPGLFLQPAFSPDGQELAYTWRANKSSHQSIYLQHVPGEDRRILIDTGFDDYSPTWSPDGSEIAFLHARGDDQPFEVVIARKQNPALRRSIATIAGAEDAFRGPATLCWSPDGHTLVTTDQSKGDESPALTLISAETGQKRQLTHTPPRMVDDQAAFSPDGAQIAFRRSQGDSSDEIYLIAASGGHERKLTSRSNPIDGLAWSTDGGRIIFSSGRATSLGSIWSLPLSGGPPTGVTTPLTHTSSPTVSPVGHRMAYVNSPNNVSVWRLPLDAHGDAQPFIASNFFDASAVYSPDGTHIAFRSDRSGTNEIWVCRADGSEPRRITHFNGPMTGSPRWAPDSRSLAFDSRGGGRADIYVANLDSGVSIRITDSTRTDSDNVVPAWSHDGRAIYYSSNRTGDWQIWRHSLDALADLQVTRHGGFNGMEAPDGSALLYVGDMGRSEIRRLSLQQDHSDVALATLGPGMWHAWAISRNSLLYLKRVPSSSATVMVRLDLKTKQTQIVGHAPEAINDSVSGSPDGRYALFGYRSNAGSSIMILNGWN
ncbi:MAG: winged helix-turn-helix domain-containing protein [Acidobacteriota bacterium]|nr:winged helix-turn-helix domain-containing protein [Acidobacteriota bacterium]